VVEYKPGALNVVAGALSRRDEPSAVSLALSAPRFSLFDEIRQEINDDSDLSTLRDAIRGGTKPASWTVVDGLILYNGRVYIGPSSPSKPALLELAHGTGNEGAHKTLHHLRAYFHTPHDRVLVQDFVRACAVCRATRATICSQGAFFNLWRYLRQFGKMSPWISWKLCPGSMASL
jgi:hypothetical protein